MNSMDIHQILDYLPHRYPLLLVDRVLTCEPGKRIVAIKNVTINEQFFDGHFPHHPVMPGVLMHRSAGAGGGACCPSRRMGVKPDDKSVCLFRRHRQGALQAPGRPGDQLELDVEIVRVSRGIWKFKARGTVDGEVALRSGTDVHACARQRPTASQRGQ